MSLVIVLLGLAAGLAVWMAVAWALVLATGRSSFADAAWSLGVGIAGVTAALLPLDGSNTQRGMIIAALVAIWAIRLGMHLLRRSWRGGDDPRYAELKRQWGENYRLQLLVFLEIQAGAAFVLALALLAAAHNPVPLGFIDAVAVLIALAAMAGEAVSDRQLAAFVKQPANKGKVCDIGLWSRSRHPNYFFEWLFWLGCAIFGLAVQPGWSWLALGAPAMMYWLLVHVSGVPPLEAHMLRSRGNLFRAYQNRVPAFWPSGS